jgi:hypothetical protein
VKPPSFVHAIALAHFFNYQVVKGGFAQLVFNAKGQYLQDLEEMLIAAGATRAQDYYVKAIRICLDNPETYQSFLAKSFVEDSELKNALHRVSIEYLRGEPQFLEEIAAFVSASEAPVSAWLERQAQL